MLLTYRLIPEIPLNPGLAVGPRHKSLHQSNIRLHGRTGTSSDLGDPYWLAKLLVQAGCGVDDGLKIGGIGVIAQSMDSVPSTCCC